MKSVAFLLLIFVQVALAQNQPIQSLDQEVSSVIEKYIADKKIPGAVVTIKKGDKVLLQKAYGYAQLKEFDGSISEHPERMTVNHLFDIASLTKVVGTTTAIMKLHDQGKLNIEAPVARYITGFDEGDKAKITLRHLLTHTSGIYEWYPLYYFSNKRADTYAFIKQLPLKYPVGEGRHYSDLGFTLLGEIIEKVSGKTLDAYLKTEIFAPLRMTHTTYNPDKTANLIAATSMGNPYEKRMIEDSTLGFVVKGLDPKSWNGWRQYLLKGEVNDGNAWYANEGISGAAGLFSPVDDLQKLVDMLKNKGIVRGKKFISSKTVSLFLTQDNFKNGLGWMMDPQSALMRNAPAGTFGHTGFTGTSMVVVPTQKLSVILLINRQNMGLQPTKDYFNPNPIREAVFKAALQFN
ncbi:serine hydrolase domain-containing protein [Runella zeae]|uniref:serine hydrolase domain-containing protein n=1 Tax=Runella zeae TaxID=94255 RepID=UPI002354A79F|nr:serine hydrolase domain-containing protein [Runella zeae]